MERLIKFVVILFFVSIFALGFYWLAWKLWCWVLPQVWATGPENIVSPGYWLFAGTFFLISLIGRQIFGGKSGA